MNLAAKASAAFVCCLMLAIPGRAQWPPQSAWDPSSPPSTDPNALPPIPPISSEFPPSGNWPGRSFPGQSNPSLRVTFFPPTAPIYGAAIADRQPNPGFNHLPVVTPETLPDYVNEFFYPALGTRIVEDTLPKNFPARLDSFADARTALLDDLKEQLRLAAAADAATSERDLRTFAVFQQPRLVALEKEAESIRDTIVRGAFLQPNADWNEIREWRLGKLPQKNPAITALAEYQVIRAAAYFSKGFSPEQRGLLREIAMELRDKLPRSLRGPSPTPAVARDPATMFFSPETSRLRLPPKLPADLATKIGAYNHDKDEVKSELRDTVVAQDRASFADRTRSFEALADRQAPRLTALAALAEDIRRGLALLPKPPPPAAPPDLPPGFAEQLDAYRRDKLALDTEHRLRLVSASHTALAGSPDLPLPARIRLTATAVQEARKQAEADFQTANAERTVDLQQRAAKMRQILEASAAGRTDPATGKPMDPAALMRAFNAAEQQFEKIGREKALYHDYRVAMLLPGLSPEQRRLLFGAALVALAQPLPDAERMPAGLLPYPDF